ncbi:MAG: energy transducer TonB [Acidobacteriota bacterium]
MRPSMSVFAVLTGATLLACSTSSPPTGSTPPAATRTADSAAAQPPCTNVQAPQLIKRVEPSYPADLKKEGVQGRVVMKASLTAEGELENIQVSESPDSRLSKLAVEAFQKWQYKPAHCAGKPVRVYITSTSNFRVD